MPKPPAPRVAVVLTGMSALDDLTAAANIARIIGMAPDAAVEVHSPNAELSITVDLDSLPTLVADDAPSYADLRDLVEELRGDLAGIVNNTATLNGARRCAEVSLERIVGALG